MHISFLMLLLKQQQQLKENGRRNDSILKIETYAIYLNEKI